MQTYEFCVTKIDYLGSTITLKRFSTERAKNGKILGQVRKSYTVRQGKRLIGLFFSRTFFPNTGQK